MSEEPDTQEAGVPPATAAAQQAAADPTRQRPLDSGSVETDAAAAERVWGTPEEQGEALAAEVTEQVAHAETVKAKAEADEAEEVKTDETEKLSRKERKAREKEEKARAEEERARAEADAKREAADAAAQEADSSAAQRVNAAVSGATLSSPGVGADSEPRAQAAAADEATARPTPRPQAAAAVDPTGEKPEVLVGAAFAGAFVFAKILKRITNR